MSTQGKRDTTPFTLQLDSGWKEPRYRLKRSEGWPQRRSEHFGEENNIFREYIGYVPARWHQLLDGKDTAVKPATRPSHPFLTATNASVRELPRVFTVTTNHPGHCGSHCHISECARYWANAARDHRCAYGECIKHSRNTDGIVPHLSNLYSEAEFVNYKKSLVI
jgi:hypothetical protein